MQRKVRPLSLVASLALALVAPACGPAPVSFSHDVQPVLTTGCAVGGSTCHSATGTGGGLRLDAANAYANLVGVASSQLPSMMLVNPGHPESSYMLHKVTGDMYTAVTGCSMSSQNCGTRMPMVGGSTLSASDEDLIRRWIEAGAPNN